MSKLIILYGHPDDPARFEQRGTQRHIPYAIEHMKGITGAGNRALSTLDEGPPPYSRTSQLAYDNMGHLRANVGSDDGKAVIADLGNFSTGGTTLLIAEP